MQKIDAVIRQLLELHGSEREGVQCGDFMEPMRAMGSEGGRLVETIIRSTNPRLGLEIGTSSGFSALCAMRGDSSRGFRLISIDHDPEKAKWARENFEKAGVSDRIEIIVDDALKAVEKLNGYFDYVLLDAAKSQNLPLIKNLLPKLNAGAVVLTDNAVTHGAELHDFLEFIRNHDELASGLINKGNGIEVTIKLAEPISGLIVPGD